MAYDPEKGGKTSGRLSCVESMPSGEQCLTDLWAVLPPKAGYLDLQRMPSSHAPAEAQRCRCDEVKDRGSGYPAQGQPGDR